jgi:hypothetical protein
MKVDGTYMGKDWVHQEATEIAGVAELEASDTVDKMDVDSLRRACVSLTGMTAYYIAVESRVSAQQAHLEAIRKLLIQMDAERLTDAADALVESGHKLHGVARVKAKPFVDLIKRLRLIVNL